MPFLKSLSENAGPPAVFKQFPEIYGPFSQMSEALMNGPSPLTAAEREIILAFAAGAMGCDYVFTGHSAVAYASGVPEGTLDQLVQDIETADVEPRLKPLLAFVQKLSVAPETMVQADADAVLAAGWEEQALQDAIAITGRAAFMYRLTAGNDFSPLDPEIARNHAAKRVEQGYVNVYKAFRSS